MKKSVKTFMTAAMFAATLGTAAANASAAQPGGGLLSSLISATAGDVATTYGPPHFFNPDETTTAEPEETTEQVTTTTAEAPPVETEEPPLMLSGDVAVPETDLNGDYCFDARDITVMKRLLLDEEYLYSKYARSRSDVNHDGSQDKQDLIQLILDLTGMPEWKPEEAAVTTTVTTSAFPATETTIFTEELPQPDYGPIGWYDSE